jgi:uncharacterized protein YegL
MTQINFGDSPQIVNPSDPHMALLFLVDTSASMKGKPIDELNEGMNRFKEQVCADSKTRDILDIAIIRFSTDWEVIQDFTPIETMQHVDFVADGSTYMADALSRAIQMVDDRSRFYRRTGTEPYKPWIILISDGKPFDDVDAMANAINDRVEYGKLAFWSLAVEGADTEVLHKLSGKRVLKLADYDFTGFFDWVNKSMRAVSVSSPGEKAKGQALPSTVTIDELM